MFPQLDGFKIDKNSSITNKSTSQSPFTIVLITSTLQLEKIPLFISSLIHCSLSTSVGTLISTMAFEFFFSNNSIAVNAVRVLPKSGWITAYSASTGFQSLFYSKFLSFSSVH